jgi:hypothetical protein
MCCFDARGRVRKEAYNTYTLGVLISDFKLAV